MLILEERDVITKAAQDGKAAGASSPVVIALHGAGGGPLGFARKLPVSAPGVMGVYPSGTEAAPGMQDYLVWNAGLCCGMPAYNKTDDVGYLAQVIDRMRANGKLASDARVDLVGHSNGGMMALRFACERPDLVHRVVAMASALVSPCKSAKGVSFLLIHGTEDRAVPINGGRAPNGRTNIDFPSQEETAANIRAGGGYVETIALQGAAHHVTTLDRALRDTRGQSLRSVIRKWFAGA